VSAGVYQHWIWPLVREHEAALILYAARILGERERARDVVQDTFLELLKGRHEKVLPYVKRWLFTVCRNRALDLVRQEKPMSTIETSAAGALPASDPEPPSRLSREEQSSALMALVGGLPARQQEVIRLRFQGELSYGEIAEVLSTTANNVAVAIHQGLKTLREKLARDRAEGLLS